MSAAAVRAFGVTTFVFEAVVLFVMVGPRARMLRPLPETVIASAIVVFLFATSVGIGLLFLRKWAALVFSLALVALPASMGVDSIGKAPVAAYLVLTAVTGGAGYANYHRRSLMAFAIVAGKMVSLNAT